MFETGMSALVLKICSEYAKALGLNFPPCVQQEINAIAQYVDLHTVKDLRVEQNGSVVTITCYTEGEQEKVFTVTLPEVNVDVLFNLIKGSSSVVVDKSEDGTHIVVRLDQSVINNINSKLVKPANPTSDSVITMNAVGTVGTKPLSEIGGGGKLYLHYILYSIGDIPVYLILWSSSPDKLTTVDKLFEYYQVPQYQNRLIPCSCGGVSTNKIGVLTLDYTIGTSKIARITYTDSNGVKTETISGNFTDVVIEV